MNYPTDVYATTYSSLDYRKRAPIDDRLSLHYESTRVYKEKIIMVPNGNLPLLLLRR